MRKKDDLDSCKFDETKFLTDTQTS